MPRKAVLLGLTVVLMAQVHVVLARANFEWTDYDGPFKIACGHNEILTRLQSSHSNYYEDRSWRFTCENPPTGRTRGGCGWTDYNEFFDKPIDFTCPDNRVLSGIASHHGNFVEDRRYRYYCCDIKGYIPSQCEVTEYQNSMDGYLDYTVPQGKVLVGTKSYHDNYYEDRQFKFEICSW